MKKLLFLLSLLVLAPIVYGQQSGTMGQLDQWVSTTTPLSSITQNVFGKPLKLTGLTPGECLTISASGLATTTGAACGGGSLSGGIPFALTYWTSPTTLGATSTPYVTAIVATSTTATSTFPIIDTTNIHSRDSSGLLFESNNGTDVGLLGAGGGSNVTWYGNHNYDTVSPFTLASFGVNKTLQSTSSPAVGYIVATSTTASSTFANGINITGGCFAQNGTCLSTGVSSVSNSDGTLTFSPTTGGVVGSLNLSNENVWQATQIVLDAYGNLAYLGDTGSGYGGNFQGLNAGLFASGGSHAATLGDLSHNSSGYFTYAPLGTVVRITSATSTNGALSAEFGSNLAVLGYDNKYGLYAVGSSSAIHAQDPGSGTYIAKLGSSEKLAAGYFEFSGTNKTWMNTSTSGIVTTGNINTTGDYYRNGLIPDVTYWTSTTFGSNEVLYQNTANNAINASSDFVFTGTDLGVGTSSPSARLAVQGATNAANTFMVLGGAGSGSSAGGRFYFLGGTGGATTGTGGAFIATAGTGGSSNGAGGAMTLTAGNAGSGSGAGGAVNITAGNGGTGSLGAGGITTITGGVGGTGSGTGGTGGALNLIAGQGGSGSSPGAGGDVFIAGGAPSSGHVLTNQGDVILGMTSASVPRGLVGVATSTPFASLSVKGTTTRSAFLVASSTNAEMFNVNANNAVGVGTSSPYAMLSVNASTKHAYFPTLFAVASSSVSTTTHFVIKATGNTGVGTSSPNSLLTVGTSTNSTATTTIFFDSNVSKGTCLVMKDFDGTGYTFITVNNGTLTASTADCR